MAKLMNRTRKTSRRSTMPSQSMGGSGQKRLSFTRRQGQVLDRMFVNKHPRAKKIDSPYSLKGIKNDDFSSKKTLTEQEVNLLKRRLNDGKMKPNDVFADRGVDNPHQLTKDQQDKGLRYLRNLHKTPRGTERANNPFGAREEHVLDNADRIELIDMHDDANYHQAQAGIRNYQPLYRVVAKDGSTFDYYVSGGKINIVG